MHLPNVSKPAVRDTRRRPLRSMDQRRVGILPQQNEDGSESPENDESYNAGDSEESGGN